MLQRIQSQDQTLSLMQDATDRELTKLQKAPLAFGRVLDVSLTSGQDNLIAHGLGYPPRLVLPMVPNVNTTIWSPTSTSLNGQSSSSTVVNLWCSASCTLSVWVT